ncbi:kinase-like protein, partial [Clavulina sp. PMI_390]
LRAHGNIVTLYGALETEELLMLVLEYVRGEDLYYFLETEQIGEGEAQDNSSRRSSIMFAQMCDAVQACHAQGISHRDIKPENFIVTTTSDDTDKANSMGKVIVKLSDFGLATTDRWSADVDCGSAPYMSYECRNVVGPTYATQPADVWSLGIVLINM